MEAEVRQAAQGSDSADGQEDGKCAEGSSRALLTTVTSSVYIIRRPGWNPIGGQLGQRNRVHAVWILLEYCNDNEASPSCSAIRPCFRHRTSCAFQPCLCAFELKEVDCSFLVLQVS